MSNYQEIIRKLCQTHEVLDNYDSILSLSSNERQKLANLLTREAKQQFLSNDVYDTFYLSMSIASDIVDNLYHQAMVCLEYALEHKSVQGLLLACDKCNEIIKLEPDFTRAFTIWAIALMLLGVEYNEIEYLHNADEKLQIASQKSANTEDLQEIYMQWGHCFYHMGRLHDFSNFQIAIEKYEYANKLGCNSAEFYCSYGKALEKLGDILKDHDMVDKAIECYFISVEDPKCINGCKCLGNIMKALYECTCNQIHFQKSYEGYNRVLEIFPDDLDTKINMGNLFLIYGRFNKDLAYLNKALNYFIEAYNHDEKNVMVLRLLSEVLISLGKLTEQLQLLRDAEYKITLALEIDRTDVLCWTTYGYCLLELGYYFLENDYYNQALHKFSYALQLDSLCFSAKQGMARALSMIGELKKDILSLEKSISHYTDCTKVMDNNAYLFNEMGTAYMHLSILTNNKYHAKKACKNFEKAVSIQRANNCLDKEILYNYGSSLDFLGDFYDNINYYLLAIENLNEVLNMDKSYSSARYNLALALMHAGELSLDVNYFRESSRYFQLLIEENIEDDYVWNEWGILFLIWSNLVKDDLFPSESEMLLQNSEEKLLQAASLGNVHSLYNLACVYSIKKYYDESMNYLERAQSSGALPDVVDLQYDEWLEEGLRQTERFRYFVKKLKNLGNL